MKLTVGKRVHYDSGPNMTPLVDVVMVILIFLMLAGSFAGTEWYLVSNLPYRGDKAAGEAPSDALVPENEPLEIRVDQNPTNDGFIARAGKIQADSITTLSGALTKMRRDLEDAGQKKEDIQVVISPGRSVTLQHVVDVFQAAQNAQFTKIGFSRAR